MTIYKVMATVETDVILYVHADSVADAMTKGEDLADYFTEEPGPSGDWNIEQAVEVEATRVPDGMVVHMHDSK